MDIKSVLLLWPRGYNLTTENEYIVMQIRHAKEMHLHGRIALSPKCLDDLHHLNQLWLFLWPMILVILVPELNWAAKTIKYQFTDFPNLTMRQVIGEKSGIKTIIISLPCKKESPWFLSSSRTSLSEKLQIWRIVCLVLGTRNLSVADSKLCILSCLTERRRSTQYLVRRHPDKTSCSCVVKD